MRSLTACMLALLCATGSLGMDVVEMVLPNGTKVVIEAEGEAVDVKDAAGRALPEDDAELKNLLNWAISHSDPGELKRQASAGTSKEAIERRQQVQEAIKRMQQEPTEAELMIEAIEILGNGTSEEDAKVGALQALHILLEPIDNANDLHKLGGIEALVSLLDGNSSNAVRAGSAFALGIAASNNEPFVIKLTERGGDEVIAHLIEIAEMEDPALAAKGLYGLSNLADSERQRGVFYEAGGLGRMQGVLAKEGASDRVHRKVASLLGDLAQRGEEFLQQMGKLPEKGKELVRSLSQHISPRNWDLSERAMHALRSIASIPGAKHAFEGSDVDSRLAKFEGEVKGENEGQKDSYLSEVQFLAHSARAKVQEALGTTAGSHSSESHGEL